MKVKPLQVANCLIKYAMLVFLLISQALLIRAESNVCAHVRIEILQELTMERQAFDARMKISNGSEMPVEDIRVEILAMDEAGNPVWITSNPSDDGAAFFVRPEGTGCDLQNEDDLWRLPEVPARSVADTSDPYQEAHWLLIPSLGAGGKDARGKLFAIGAVLRYKWGGQEQLVEVAPDTIQVMPMPDLALDYFLPIQVSGDDPMTAEIEPSIPFPLAVRLRNVGYGTAMNVAIDSGQPKIVENSHGLAIGFELIGSQVNGKPASPSLKVNFGDVPPGETRMASWTMKCSMAGKFLDFGVRVSHADNLGGRVTSLLRQENIHTHALIRNVYADRPVDMDGIEDYLVCEWGVGKADIKSLQLFLSNGSEQTVTCQSAGAKLKIVGNNICQIIKDPGDSDPGYVFLSVPISCPAGAEIKDAVRSDGKIIDPRNVWIDSMMNNGAQCQTLCLFDVDSGQKTYEVSFLADGPKQNQPPVIRRIPDYSVRAGQMLGFLVFASDPDGQQIELYSGSLPNGAGFNNNGNGNGAFAWYPTLSQVGQYRVQIMASDGDLTSEQWVNITVVPPDFNRPPSVSDLTLTTEEDTFVSGLLMGTDQEGDPLTFHLEGSPSNGQLVMDPAKPGAFTYTPNKDWNGTEVITFRANDGKADSVAGVLSIVVNAVNDPPLTASATIATMENTPSDPVRPTVVDVDNTAHAISIETQPQHGMAAVDKNRLIYTPSTDYVGPDSFTFRATDDGGLSVVGNATVTVREKSFDIEVADLQLKREASPSGVTGRPAQLEAVLTSNRTRPVNGAVVVCNLGAEEIGRKILDLAHGSTRVIFDLPNPLPTGDLLKVTLQVPDSVTESDAWNNSATLAFQDVPPVVTSSWSLPSAFTPEARLTLSGRSMYRLTEGFKALEGGAVHVAFWKDGSDQPVSEATGRSDRNGAWHVRIQVPSAPDIYRLTIAAGDGAANDMQMQMVHVDVALVAPAPYAGPSGLPANVTFASPGVWEPWVVLPGMPVPTSGAEGSGVRGGETGSGQSASVFPEGPAAGSRGGAAQLFDARVEARDLTASSLTPEVGARVQIHGIVKANDSFYAMPLRWQVTAPDGTTVDWAPVTWYYSNGDLHLATSFVPPTAGTWSVRLSLANGWSDSDPNNDAAALNLVVKNPNRVPEIGSATLPTHAYVREDVTFDATATDADSDPLAYSWTFGDGATATGTVGRAVHAYATTGTFSVNLLVEDGKGGTATRTGTIVVDERPNRPPVIGQVTRPPVAQVHVAANFGATATDPDGDTLTYLWNFGDGSTAEGSTTSHAFAATGSYSVSLEVTDGRGGKAMDLGQVRVREANRPPVIQTLSIPAQALPGQEVVFRVDATDPDGDPLTITWTFGGTETAAGAEVRHTWATAGSYPVTVTVDDGLGGRVGSNATIRVAPSAASGDLNGDGRVNSADLTILLYYKAGVLLPGVPPFTGTAQQADLTGDGKVDAQDILILANWMAGNP